MMLKHWEEKVEAIVKRNKKNNKKIISTLFSANDLQSFSLSNSVRIISYHFSNQIELLFPLDKSFVIENFLRIDLLNDISILQIESIVLEGEQKMSLPLDKIQIDSKYHFGNWLIFDKTPSTVIINLESFNLDSSFAQIKVNLNVVGLGLGVINEIGDFLSSRTITTTQKEKPYVAKLYIQTEEENFAEKNSISVNIDENAVQIHFELPTPQNISALRFDPLEEPCSVRLIAIKMVMADQQILELSPIECQVPLNALKLGEQFYFFDHDPQIYYHFEKSIQIKSVSIELSFQKIGKIVFSEISSLFHQLDHEKKKKQTAIQNLKEELQLEKQGYENKIKEQNDQISQLEELIINLKYNATLKVQEISQLVEQKNILKSECSELTDLLKINKQSLSKQETQLHSLNHELKITKENLTSSQEEVLLIKDIRLA